MADMVPLERITSKIYFIRSMRVMLDRDLAQLYEIENRILKQAVRRNIHRFPPDFMFELTKKENLSLRSQNVTLKRGQHSKYLPFVFTEQGVAMLSSVLNSDRAIIMNIAIMRAFVQLRKVLESHTELARKLSDLEQKLDYHDEQIRSIFEAIRRLIATPEKERKKKIGFTVKDQQEAYGNRMK